MQVKKGERSIDHESFNRVIAEFGLPPNDEWFRALVRRRPDEDPMTKFIDVAQFMTGLATIVYGDLTQRLELVFDMYDADGDGRIDKNELYEVIRGFNARAGNLAFVTEQNMRDQVDTIFEHVDTNRDGCALLT